MTKHAGKEALRAILNAIFSKGFECNLDTIFSFKPIIRDRAMNDAVSKLSSVLHEIATIIREKNKEAGKVIEPLLQWADPSSLEKINDDRKYINGRMSGGGYTSVNECIVEILIMLRNSNVRYSVLSERLKKAQQKNNEKEVDEILKQLETLDKEFEKRAKKDCEESWSSLVGSVASRLIPPVVVMGVPAAATYGIKMSTRVPVSVVANAAGIAGDIVGSIIGNTVGFFSTSVAEESSKYGSNVRALLSDSGDGILVLIFIGLFFAMLFLYFTGSFVKRFFINADVKFGMLGLHFERAQQLRNENRSSLRIANRSSLRRPRLDAVAALLQITNNQTKNQTKKRSGPIIEEINNIPMGRQLQLENKPLQEYKNTNRQNSNVQVRKTRKRAKTPTKTPPRNPVKTPPRNPVKTPPRNPVKTPPIFLPKTPPKTPTKSAVVNLLSQIRAGPRLVSAPLPKTPVKTPPRPAPAPAFAQELLKGKSQLRSTQSQPPKPKIEPKSNNQLQSIVQEMAKQMAKRRQGIEPNANNDVWE